jgi:hypothetical protein
VRSADDPRGDGLLADWPARVAENLTGRRILARAAHGVEAEPATLAQVIAATRLPQVLTRLRGRTHPVAAAGERAANEVIGAFVATLAANPDLHAAAWREGPRAIGVLTDLLEQLDKIAADATAAAATSPAAPVVHAVDPSASA